MIDNNVDKMARIDVKGDVDDQRAKSRPHVLLVWISLQHWGYLYADGTCYVAMYEIPLS